MHVIIGVDPHKATHTAVAVSEREDELARVAVRASRVQTERLLTWAQPFTLRTWAIEGADGMGYLVRAVPGERDDGRLAALAEDPQRAMPAIDAEIADVGVARFTHPEAVVEFPPDHGLCWRGDHAAGAAVAS